MPHTWDSWSHLLMGQPPSRTDVLEELTHEKKKRRWLGSTAGTEPTACTSWHSKSFLCHPPHPLCSLRRPCFALSMHDGLGDRYNISYLPVLSLTCSCSCLFSMLARSTSFCRSATFRPPAAEEASRPSGFRLRNRNMTGEALSGGSVCCGPSQDDRSMGVNPGDHQCEP